MTYYDRLVQLKKTLASFLKYDPMEFNVIIVDDGSPEPIDIPKMPFDVTIIRIENKKWYNPVSVFNTGFLNAIKMQDRHPDIIIIQNAECFHVGDILTYAKRVTDETYIAFGAYSLNQHEDVKGYVLMNDRWYNHPQFNPTGYHFCSAITTKNLIKINGFDERFSQGIAYDDNYLLHQIKSLGLKIELTSLPYVLHQWHPKYNSWSSEELDKKQGLIEKNRLLYEELIKNNNYRGVHILTKDFDE